MHAFSSFIFSLHMVLMCGLESRIKLLLTSDSAAIYHLQGSLDRVSLRDQFSQFPSLMLAGARGGAALLMCHTDTGHQGAPWHVTVCQCSPLHLWCVSPTSNYDTGQVTRTKCIFLDLLFAEYLEGICKHKQKLFAVEAVDHSTPKKTGRHLISWYGPGHHVRLSRQPSTGLLPWEGLSSEHCREHENLRKSV